MVSTDDLVPGLPVETLDHRRIGSLAGVSEDRILVQPRFDEPYWLPDILIRDVAASGVMLHLGHDRIKRYRQPASSTHRVRGSRWHALSISAAAVMTAVAWVAALGG